MKQVRAAKEGTECKGWVRNKDERKDENNVIHDRRYKRHDNDIGLCTSHDKLASLSTYSFQTYWSARNIRCDPKFTEMYQKKSKHTQRPNHHRPLGRIQTIPTFLPRSKAALEVLLCLLYGVKSSPL